MMTTKEDPTRWYDRVARLYDPFILGSYNRARQRTIQQLRLEPGQTVLDVACGTGENFRFILEKIGPTGRLIGTDFSEGMLAQARRKIEKNGWQNVHLLHADARSLSQEMLTEAVSVPELNVERVICTLGLSVVPEWEDVFARTWGILAEDGRYAIMDWYTPRKNIFTGFVNRMAASDISRRWWEPLMKTAVAFEQEKMVGGLWRIVSGSKSLESA
jgi:ubiquinone/menaquinone biosynthesis C-methylase UbiE